MRRDILDSYRFQGNGTDTGTVRTCVTGSPSFNVEGFRLAAVSELPCQLDARLSFYMRRVGHVSI